MKTKTNKKADASREVLPSWDLSRAFYTGHDDPQIQIDLLRIKATVKEIVKYEGQISELRPYEFALLVRLYDGLCGLVRKLLVYSHLLSDTNLDNQEITNFAVSISEKVDELIEPISFLTKEIRRISDYQKYELLLSPKLRRYVPWLERIFYSADVDDTAMYVFSKKSATEGQWSKLYNETCSKMEFVYQGQTYNAAEIFALKERAKTEEEEKGINEIINQAFKQNAHIFTNCLNAIMKNEDVDAKLFGYYNAENESFDENMIPREDLLLLVSAVTDSFIPMSRRFYALRDKLYSSKKCNPVGNPIKVPEKRYSWAECKKIVLSAYKEFSPMYEAYGKSIIDAGIIDVGTKKGKKDGAYCMPGETPYILLNFTGNESDIRTLAHELGHGIHHLLCSQQGYLNDATPISLAEVASEFAENIVFQKQISMAKSNTEKLYLLIARVSEQIGTIHAQIGYYNFEKRVHAERQRGSLTTERLNQIWAEEQERYTGKKLEGDNRYRWMRISHLFNSPFYVYCYAFAGILVNNLIKVYEDGDLDNIDLCDFSARFMEMLSNTGVEPYRDLLEAFELDVDDPKFWRDGLKIVEDSIDEIERLAKEEGLL